MDEKLKKIFINQMSRDIQQEIRSYPEFPQYYVSEDGRIFTFSKNKLIEKSLWQLFKDNYYFVNICYKGEDGKRKNTTRSRGRMLLWTFIRPPEGNEQCNHKDADKTNDRLSNLEWCSPRENVAHSFTLGRRENTYGTKHTRAKLTPEKVKAIRLLHNTYHISNHKLAKIFEVTPACIWKIVNRKNWIRVI